MCVLGASHLINPHTIGQPLAVKTKRHIEPACGLRIETSNGSWVQRLLTTKLCHSAENHEHRFHAGQ